MVSSEINYIFLCFAGFALACRLAQTSYDYLVDYDTVKFIDIVTRNIGEPCRDTWRAIAPLQMQILS